MQLQKAPNPPWQRLTQVQETTAAFSGAAERGAAEEGLALHQHYQVFTGHRQISRSQVGVKCHLPSPQSPLPESLLCKEGHRPRVSWASPSRDQLVLGASLLVPKSHQLLPTPGRHTTLQASPCPCCLWCLLWHHRASPHADTLLALAKHIVPGHQSRHLMLSLYPTTKQEGCCGHHVQSFFWRWGAE